MSGGDILVEIYLDVLFGINFIMDFLVIFIVNKICKYAATYFKIFISAAFGAIWSVIAVIMPINIRWFINICTYILVSYVMIRICAGRCGIKSVIKGVGILYAVTLTLGGAIHVLYYYTYTGWLIKHIVVRDNRFIIFVLTSVVLVVLIYLELIRAKTYNSCKCHLICVISGEKVEMMGYIDTGNVLIDPIYKKPVTVVEKSMFSKILSKIKDYTTVKYHLIPFNSLGCEHGLMEVIAVDTMYIYYGSKKETINGALVGLITGKLSTDGEYTALINSAYAISGKV